jgi:Ulp1 protease family, C-terminal catalytic domain
VFAAVVYYYYSSLNIMVKSHGKEKGSVANNAGGGANAGRCCKAKAPAKAEAPASDPEDVYDAREIAAPDVHDIDARDVVGIFGPFEASSLQTLRPGVWLNDEVMHRFFDLLFIADLRQCRMDSSRKRSIYFPSFFITRHKDAAVRGQYDYQSVKNRGQRKKRAVDIFDVDKLLIPINQGTRIRWVCAVVSMKEKTIRVLDSLAGNASQIQKALLRFLQEDEHQHKKNIPLPDLECWRLLPRKKSMPRQPNGYDCGVFVCKFATAILFEGKSSRVLQKGVVIL